MLILKIHILFPISENATGGGNQFLKMLKLNLQKRNLYAGLEDADVILFNSHHCIPDVVEAKRRFPNKIFIHRIDGVMKLYSRPPEDMRDYIVRLANEWISDGNIYQSEWSRERNYECGIQKKPYEIMVHNAADSNIFNHDGKCAFDRERKIRIIATSWSSNIRKGFPVYQYLDHVLDWNKYEMTFVGNSPVSFEHIVHKPPMNSVDLAKEIKQYDIYISACQKDACSNSLIEALSCGLPAVCLKDGGHPELVESGGLLFEEQEEIPKLLEEIADNYSKYQQSIQIISMEAVVNKYVAFAEQVKKAVEEGKYTPKKIGYLRARSIVKQTKKWGGAKYARKRN